MKFELLYTYKNGADVIRQYWNLRDWLQEKDIKHTFEWVQSGNYVPQYVIIEDEQDATMFSLMMNHGIKVKV